MGGYSKLYQRIVTSSVWVEPDKTLRVWIAMLAMTDANGYVSGTVPGFANLCMMDCETFRRSIQPLLDPDPDSRTKDYEGRRLALVEGGWQILNYIKHRQGLQVKEGSRAEYFRQYREQKKKEAKHQEGAEAAQGAIIQNERESGAH